MVLLLLLLLPSNDDLYDLKDENEDDVFESILVLLKLSVGLDEDADSDNKVLLFLLLELIETKCSSNCGVRGGSDVIDEFDDEVNEVDDEVAKIFSMSMGVTFLDSVRRRSRSLAFSSTPIIKASFRFSFSTNSFVFIERLTFNVIVLLLMQL
jgi:hypothetical protein